MADYERLLRETISFHQELIRYANLLQNETQGEASARLRRDLTIQWGRVEGDLSKLGLPRHYTQFGRVRPMFESALQPLEDRYAADFDAIRLSVQALELMIGVLQKKIEEGPPVAMPAGSGGFFFGAAVVLALIAGAWYIGRRQSEIVASISELYGRFSAKAFSGNVLWLVACSVVSAVSGGLFANLIHDVGWGGAWRAHRLKAILYLAFLVVAGAGAIILAKQ